MKDKRIKLRLVLDIDYNPNNENLETLRGLINRMPTFLYGNGMMTGDTSAEVNEWKYIIKQRK